MGEIKKIFIEVVRELNKSNIKPIIYGSLGLWLKLERDAQVNDIDLIIEMPEQFEICKQVLSGISFQQDPDHERELIRDELYCSFIDKRDIEDLIGEPLVCDEVTMNNCTFFNISLTQYQKIYEKGLENVYRKEKKEKDDLEKIRLIENFIKYGILKSERSS